MAVRPGSGVEIPIEARLGGFDAAFRTLVAGAQQASDRMGAAFGRLRGIAATLGLGLSAAGFASFVKGSIDAADRLNDLSKATGVAVSSLGGIGFAAEQAGADLDGVAKAFGKLNLLAADALAGNEKAAETFRKLGVSVADIRALKPEELFAKVADAFASFDDDANKAAGANAIFGKSYQSILPLLDEGGEALRKNIGYYERYARMSDDLVKASDAFNDELTKSGLLIRSLGNQLAASLLPSMQALTKHFSDASERGEGFNDTADLLARGLRALATPVVILAGGFVQLGEAIAGAGAASVAFFSGDFKRAGAIGADLMGRLDEIGKRYMKLAGDVFNGTAAAADAAEKGASTRTRRRTPSFGAPGSNSADDTAKRLLEQRLRGLESEIRDEQTLLRDRESFLQDYYQDNLVDISGYFAKRQALQRDALSVELRAYDDMAAALRERIQTADPKDRIDLETRLADVADKRARAEQQTATRGIQLWFDENRAVREFTRGLEQAALQIEQMRGNQATAAGFGFDIQNEELLRRISLEKQSADTTLRQNAQVFEEKMRQLREMTVAQARFNEEQVAFAGVADQVSAAQARIAIAVQSGQATELEGLARLSDANRARLDDMQQVIDRAQEAYEALRAAFGADSPITVAAARDLDNLKLKMEELAATGDLVAKKFNDIGTSAFSTFLQDLTTGKWQDALKNLGNNLFQGINRVVADNLSQSAFKPDGIFGGFGKVLSALFGGSNSGAATLAAAGTTMTTAGTTMLSAGTLHTSAAAALSTAAASLTAAAASLGAGSASSGANFLSLFGSTGGLNPADFAVGGSFGSIPAFAAGTPFVQRTGLALLHKGERVVTAADNRAGKYGRSGDTNVTVVQNIGMVTSTQTARQASKSALRSAVRARTRG